MPVTSSNKHPLAWGSLNGPVGQDTNSLASKMAAKALQKEAEQKAAIDRLIWLAQLEQENA